MCKRLIYLVSCVVVLALAGILAQLNKDLDLCLKPNRFDFSMVIQKVDGNVVMHCEPPIAMSKQ